MKTQNTKWFRGLRASCGRELARDILRYQENYKRKEHFLVTKNQLAQTGRVFNKNATGMANSIRKGSSKELLVFNYIKVSKRNLTDFYNKNKSKVDTISLN